MKMWFVRVMLEVLGSDMFIRSADYIILRRAQVIQFEAEPPEIGC